MTNTPRPVQELLPANPRASSHPSSRPNLPTGSTSGATASTPTLPAEAILFAGEFFIAAVKLLGQRWVSKHGAEPSREWQRLLAPYAHLSPEACAGKLVAGLKPNDRGEVWPPEIADVVHMLRPKPEDFGLPPVSEAYRAACHGRWIHPAVYEAARRVGTFELRNQAEARSRPEFEREYAEVCAEFMAGNTKHWPQRVDKGAQVEHKPSPHQGNAAIAKQRCDMLRRCIGPIAAPAKPEPVQPVNDEDFQRIRDEQAAALAEMAGRYQGAQ